jgi:hypothetical protein
MPVADGASSAGEPSLPVVGSSEKPVSSWPPAVGVPRRFSVGTLMVLTTFFAVLFAILKSCGVPPIFFVDVSIFVAGVAVSQVLLFRGKDPRRASVISGMVLFLVIGVSSAAYEYADGWNVEGVATFIMTVVASIPLGAILGYCAGGLVASVFLVRKERDEAEPEVEPSKGVADE